MNQCHIGVKDKHEIITKRETTRNCHGYILSQMRKSLQIIKSYGVAMKGVKNNLECTRHCHFCWGFSSAPLAFTDIKM